MALAEARAAEAEVLVARQAEDAESQRIGRSRQRWLLTVNALTFGIASFAVISGIARTVAAVGGLYPNVAAIGPTEVLLLAFVPGPVWAYRDSNGFRRGTIATRSFGRRTLYWLTGLPGVLVLAYTGVAAIAVVAVGALVLLLLGAASKRDAQVGIVEEGVRRAMR